MCLICKSVGKIPQQRALDLIAEEMKKPKANFEHLDNLLNKVLGMKTQEDDPEADEAWERNRYE